MKKKMFLLGFCILMVSTIVLGCFSASAATTTSSGSYILSKSDQTEKKHTKSLSVSGGGSATVTAQHWKGVLSLHILIPLIPKLIAAAV